jgi:acetyltransferase-like isoleucine patch superfamily enzyme
MTRVVLFGVGSPLVVDYEESCRRLGWRISLAVRNHQDRTFCGDDLTIKEPSALATDDLAIPFLCPLFTPCDRRAAASQAVDLGFSESPALVDPTAVVAENSSLGAGSYVNAGCIVGAQVICGRHVVLNRACSIGHNGQIGDFVSIGPGVVVAGQVTIGPGTMLGAGCVILPQIEIGGNTVIGAGTVVAENVGDLLVVTGNRELVKRPRSEGGAK